MIEFPVILGHDGRSIVRQSLVHPSVYLDTCAIREFAEHDEAARKRFCNALIAARGTLVISPLSVVDFAGLSDRRHSEAAAAFIDSCSPSLFFSEFQPFDVDRNEIATVYDPGRGSPFGREDVLRSFAETTVYSGRPSVKPFFDDMFRRREQVSQFRSELAAAIRGAFEQLRAHAEREPGFMKIARGSLKAASLSANRILLLLLCEQLVVESTSTTKQNSAIDFCQSIAPSAYCTCVLVDGEWHDRLIRAQRRIRAEGLSTKIATSYTKRRGGVERFLEALEGHAVSGRL